MLQAPNYIDVTPNDYVFFDDVPKGSSISYVTMKNLTSRRVAFKIRTTSPKGYVVKPNNGIIGPNETKKIEFTMNPVDDVTSRRNNQDKFLIMAVELDEHYDVSRLSDVWKEKPANIQQNLKLTAAYKGSNLAKSQQFGSGFGQFGRGHEDERPRMSVPLGRGTANAMFQSSTGSPNPAFGHKLDNENYDRIENKMIDQERLITKLTEERNQFFNELTTLRENLERSKTGKGGHYSTYQLWHVLLVAVLGLIIGAFLSADRKNFSSQI